MAVDARDARRVPIQAIRDQTDRGVRQIRLAMINHQAVSPKVLESMRLTVTIVAFLRPLVGNTDRAEHAGRATAFQGRELFLLEFVRKLIESLGPALEDDLVIVRPRAHKRPLPGLVGRVAESGGGA